MEIIFEGKDLKVVRFTCDCTNPACAIDVTMYKEGTLIELSFWSIPTTIWNRICCCYLMLTKGMGIVHDFVLRGEDVEDFVKVVKGEG